MTVLHSLRAVPSQQAAKIMLTWGGVRDGASASVRRWTTSEADAEVIVTHVTGNVYTDSHVSANTVYYYRAQIGRDQSEVAVGVVSDIAKPFVVPAMAPVSPSLMGVERTENWTGPDGIPRTFTIRVPTANALTVTVEPPVGTANALVNAANVGLVDSVGSPLTIADDYNNIKAAIAAVKAVGSGTIRLGAGDYVLYPPSDALANIYISTMNDVILEGAARDANGNPTTNVYFRKGGALNNGTVQGLIVDVTNRILIRNISFDWDFPNAIPGNVTRIDANTCRFDVINPTYYIPDPTNPPQVRGVTMYHLAARCYNLTPGGRQSWNGTFNPDFGVNGEYYYRIDSVYQPEGEAIFYVSTSHGIQIGPGTTDASLEYVNLFGGGGAGLLNAPQSRGLRVSNCRFTRRPDSLLRAGELPRLTAFFGDSDANAARGDILIENSEFGWQNDDYFYLRGPIYELSALASTSSFTMTAASPIINHTLTAGKEAILFIDRDTQAAIGDMPQASWTQTLNAGTWTLTVSFSAIVGLAPYIGHPADELPLWVQPDWCCPNFIIRNSVFHDSYGRVFACTHNGVIEDNVFANSYYNAIEIGATPTGLPDGPGPRNILVRRNKVIGCGSGLEDINAFLGVSDGHQQTGWALGAISVYGMDGTGFMASGFPFKHISINDNFICNTPGLAIAVHGAEDVEVLDNIIVDANVVPFAAGFNETYCGVHSQGQQAFGMNQPWCLAKTAGQGALMVTHSRRVDALRNLFLGTSAGVFVDASTSSAVTTSPAPDPDVLRRIALQAVSLVARRERSWLRQVRPSDL